MASDRYEEEEAQNAWRFLCKNYAERDRQVELCSLRCRPLLVHSPKPTAYYFARCFAECTTAFASECKK